MVTAPMMTEGLDVDLPRTEAVEALPTDSDHVVLTIRKDGVIFINEIQTGLDTLAQQLVSVVKVPGRRLFLQADKDVPYGVVVGIMGRIRAAGIEEMGIVAERIDDVTASESAPGTGVQARPRPPEAETVSP
jgi:biopolymer transport protein TolR